jgi:hypothetical protein
MFPKSSCIEDLVINAAASQLGPLRSLHLKGSDLMNGLIYLWIHSLMDFEGETFWFFTHYKCRVSLFDSCLTSEQLSSVICCHHIPVMYPTIDGSMYSCYKMLAPVAINSYFSKSYKFYNFLFLNNIECI